MAIDNREKRQSAYGAFHVKGVPAVTPNAANDQEWRQEAFWGYSGILATAPSAAILAYFSVASFIQEYGIGSLSTITTAATSMNSAMDESQGFTSIIQTRGQGVTSSIDETGQSVSSTV